MGLKMKRGTIQVDLDGLWTILGYYGMKHPVENDPIYETAIPRFIELFRKYDLKATFFVIGRDLEVPKKRKLIQQLAKEGHEIANHTYNHHFGFRKLPREKKEAEISKTELLIQKATGTKPAGFKAPGYDLDEQGLQILQQRGYAYDSSVLPSFYYQPLQIANSILNRTKIRTHGPRIRWGFAPNKPYRISNSLWRKTNRKDALLEVPCTVMPWLRLPFQTAFIFLAGMRYFKAGYLLTKRKNIPLNYTFHAIDLADDIKDKNIPSTQRIPLRKRMKICEQILQNICKDYKIMTTTELISQPKKK